MAVKTEKKVTTAKKVAAKAPVKKVAAKAPVKKATAKVAKPVAKKTAAKKVAKKVTAKAAPAKTAKKVAKKTAAVKTAKAPVKKAAKKIAKKVTKKTPAAKIVKKAKCGCCEHAVTKKTPAKAAAKPAAAKKSAVVRDANKPLNKSQLVALISEQVDLEKKKVSAVLDTITDIIAKELKKPGLFQIPGLVKIEKKTLPAQKAIKDWKTPFPGEIGTKPAKPASTKVKVRALKKLKDMA
jgi:nucleoid DNA-binding protein